MAKALWGALARPRLGISRREWTDDDRRRWVRALTDALDGRAWTDPDRLLAYSFDATGERHLPDAVVFVESPDDVIRALALARAFQVPVIGRGAATGLSGGATPVAGGVLLTFARFNQVRRLDRPNRTARVDPGLVNADFQAALAPLGLFFAPDPSSHRISTLGGNASENSGGPHCVKYGVTTNHILGGEVVLADQIARSLPTTRDFRPGFDLTGLIVGSEGTLAILTAIDVVLTPMPPATETLLAAFDRLETATDAVSAIIGAGIVPSTLELIDRPFLETIERFAHAGYPDDADAVLLIEVDGSEAATEDARQRVEAILREMGAVRVLRATTAEEVALLWKGRRSSYGAAAQIASHLWIQDVTVPRPLLSTMLRRVLAIGETYRFPIMTVAHAGDGNLHPNLPYDPSDAEEVERMRAADQAILQACVELGGSISGEHGIGIDKLEQLALMYGPAERQKMAGVKEVFDPDGLLNPYKAILPADYVSPADTDRVEPPAPPPVRDLIDAIRDAGTARRPLRVVGSGRWEALAPSQGAAERLSTERLRKVRDLDRANLTVTVETGVRGTELADVLSAEGFMIPALEPSPRTLGGLLATQSRYWGERGLGWRDHVLAVEWVDGSGTLLRFGRKTMKNVAGYDMVKLAIGSWGQLGVLTAATLRLYPRQPERTLAFVGPAEDLAALALALRNAPEPPRGLLLRWDAEPTLYVRLQGPDLDAQEASVTERWGGPGQECDPDQVDQDHAAAIAQAIAAGSYVEGGGPPASLAASLLPGDVLWAFPTSGAKEWTRFGALPPDWTRRLTDRGPRIRRDPAWAAIEAGLADLFDPHRLFPRWKDDPDD